MCTEAKELLGFFFCSLISFLPVLSHPLTVDFIKVHFNLFYIFIT